MTSNLPRLSICIATRNRASYIGETLDSIIAQLTDGVEIVVLDGASEDNTEEVVRARQQRSRGLRYVRQDVNNGFDQDYARAVELARGEYCWLMSDDDVLRPGAVDAVLAGARRGYSLIVVNSEVRNVDLSQTIEGARLHVSSDRVYSAAEGDQFFLDCAGYLTFVGCVVMRRDMWDAREKQRYFGTAFVHVGVIFQAPLAGEVLVIAEPWIVIRHGNASWSARSFAIWMFQWPELIWSFSQFDEAARLRVARPEPWRRVGGLLYHRAVGAYTLREYRTWLARRISSRAGRLVAAAVAVLPRAAATAGMVVYHSIFRRGSKVALAELKRSGSEMLATAGVALPRRGGPAERLRSVQ